jgi:hypothetical protein
MILLGGIRLVLIVGDVHSGVLANVTAEAARRGNARAVSASRTGIREMRS